MKMILAAVIGAVLILLMAAGRYNERGWRMDEDST